MTTRLYLVEHYGSDSSPATVLPATKLVGLAAARGRVRHVQTLTVPADDAYLSLYEAESAGAVEAAYAAAGVDFARISEALLVNPEWKEDACARLH